MLVGGWGAGDYGDLGDYGDSTGKKKGEVPVLLVLLEGDLSKNIETRPHNFFAFVVPDEAPEFCGCY